MPDPLSADRTAELLIWYFQEPARYHAEGRRRDAPRLDSEVVLKLALGRRVDFAAPPTDAKTIATLQRAAALYVRHLFFRPDATPYQILGLAPGASPQMIKESFRLLMQLVHPDRQDELAVWPDAFAAQANRAYRILRNQDTRARFDREAEARAAMARAMHRAAAASAASKMPVVLRPRPLLGGGLLRRMALPEWLTAGVGGYAREHPAAIAFAVLIVAAALTVGTMGWERQEGWLTREAHEGQEPPAPTQLAAPRASPAPAVSVAGAFEPTGSPSRGASPKSSRLEDSSALPGRVAAANPEGHPPPASGVTAQDSLPAPRAAPTPAEAAVPVQVAVVAKEEQGSAPAPPSASGAATPAVPNLASTPAAANVVVAPTPAAMHVPLPGAERVALVTAAGAPPLPPATTEIETLFATFVEAYERGRGDAFAALFDADADADLHRGRAAIRIEYDELFRLSQWRRMQLTRINWKRVGDRAVAKGEITVRIGWRDGREVEQRLAVDMELVRRDGRVLIARLSQQPKP